MKKNQKKKRKPRKTCEATTKAGAPCRGWTGLNGLCPVHNGRGVYRGGWTSAQRASA